MALWSRLTGGVAAFGIGAAARDAVEPELEPLKQTAWKNAPHKVLSPLDVASIRAREKVTGTPGIDRGDVDLGDDAARSGVGSKRLDLLTELMREHPGLGPLLELRRRNIARGDPSGITREEFREGLRRQGFTSDWIDDLTKLLTVYLSPADYANAIQQGFVPGEGILASPPSGDTPWTIPVEEVPLSPTEGAAIHGLSKDDLTVLAQLSGLPPGPVELAQMVFRGIIDEQSFEHGVREGHTKTKWTNALRRLMNPLLNPGTVINLLLRGWIDKAEADRRMALRGYTPQQVQDWFDASGRPMAPVQAFNAWARGAPSPLRKNPDGTPATFNKADFIEAIRRSDIRPEYGEPLWSLRWNYPPLFQLRRAVESGGMTKERAAEIMHIERYEPQDIASLLASWKVANGASVDPHVGRAQTQLWSTTHRTYLAGDASEAQARTKLQQLGVPAAAQDSIITLWNHERELVRQRLTAAQVKKAYAKAVTNPATGVAWTRDDALAELLSRGWSANDANTFLSE